jgi:LPS export ABC transporter protein LptC
MRARHYKWGLVTLIVISVGATVWTYVSHRRATNRPSAILDQIDAGADMRLGRIHQTATRDGVKEWDLIAGSAQYIDNQKRVVFDDVGVTFYLKNRQEVTLTADKGDLQTESKNLVVSGNVIVKNQGYRLETEALSYQHDSQVVQSEVPVVVSGDRFRLAGDSLLIDLAGRQAEMDGRVKASFYVDFTL